MRRLIFGLGIFASAFLVACGGGVSSAQTTTARQALTGTAEMLEFETPQTRQQLFREIAVASTTEAGRQATPEVLFPIVNDGEVIAAPGFEPQADLLQAWDAGHPVELVFDNSGRWAQDRRDSLQGLSEREAAELVARSLINRWGITPKGPVEVDRAAGAPYAAAYMDGILRINPSFLYLAASTTLASPAPSVQ